MSKTGEGTMTGERGERREREKGKRCGEREERRKDNLSSLIM